MGAKADMIPFLAIRMKYSQETRMIYGNSQAR